MQDGQDSDIPTANGSPPSKSEPASSSDDGYWIMPIPPPLYRTPIPGMPRKRTPRYVFGWALTYEDQLAWADKLGIPKEEDCSDAARIGVLWDVVLGMLPRNIRKITAVRCIWYGNPTAASCISIGTNLSTDQINRVQDEEFIGRVWNKLDLDIDPNWYLQIS